MDPSKSAPGLFGIPDLPPAAATATTATTTTTTTTAAAAVVTAPTMRMDERRSRETTLFLDQLPPEILGEIGRKLYVTCALRPTLNAMSRVNHAGKSLAIFMCSKLTARQASDQWFRDWLQLNRFFKQDQKERYLASVRTIARQLTMTPINPSEYVSEHFGDITAPEFLAAVPRLALSCNSPGAGKAALALIESQLQMAQELRTEITLNFSSNINMDLLESLLAAAEPHGNCVFNIVESGDGSGIAAAATKNLLRYMSFFPGSKGTAAVAAALKGNTSLNAASIVFLQPMEMDDLLLALSRLPRLHRLEIHLPGPNTSPALADMVKGSVALADLKIMTSHRPSADASAADALQTHARAQLKLALETRGSSFRYEIDPVYLPELPGTPSAKARQD